MSRPTHGRRADRLGSLRGEVAGGPRSDQRRMARRERRRRRAGQLPGRGHAGGRRQRRLDVPHDRLPGRQRELPRIVERAAIGVAGDRPGRPGHRRWHASPPRPRPRRGRGLLGQCRRRLHGHRRALDQQLHRRRQRQPVDDARDLAGLQPDGQGRGDQEGQRRGALPDAGQEDQLRDQRRSRHRARDRARRSPGTQPGRPSQHPGRRLDHPRQGELPRPARRDRLPPHPGRLGLRVGPPRELVGPAHRPQPRPRHDRRQRLRPEHVEPRRRPAWLQRDPRLRRRQGALDRHRHQHAGRPDRLPRLHQERRPPASRNDRDRAADVVDLDDGHVQPPGAARPRALRRQQGRELGQLPERRDRQRRRQPGPQRVRAQGRHDHVDPLRPRPQRRYHRPVVRAAPPARRPRLGRRLPEDDRQPRPRRRRPRHLAELRRRRHQGHAERRARPAPGLAARTRGAVRQERDARPDARLPARAPRRRRAARPPPRPREDAPHRGRRRCPTT
jgi:hypothetical protein